MILRAFILRWTPFLNKYVINKIILVGRIEIEGPTYYKKAHLEEVLNIRWSWKGKNDKAPGNDTKALLIGLHKLISEDNWANTMKLEWKSVTPHRQERVWNGR